MNISEIKLAAYLEEAGDSLQSACDVLKESQINYVALRNTWTDNICNVNDATCSSIKYALTKNSISVVAIVSDLGSVFTSQLPNISIEKINRALNLAQFYGAKYIRFGIGIKSNPVSMNAINSWMRMVFDYCDKVNVIPLFELADDLSVSTPFEILEVLKNKWKIIYDPAKLIIHQNINHFVKYWTILKQFVDVVDVRDFKIGVGFKPVGFGDSKIKLIIEDAINSGFKGWFFLEPSLGRKHGSAVSKCDTFKMALDALKAL